MTKGWHFESNRHSLARRGIKTKKKKWRIKLYNAIFEMPYQEFGKVGRKGYHLARLPKKHKTGITRKLIKRNRNQVSLIKAGQYLEKYGLVGATVQFGSIEKMMEYYKEHPEASV